MPTYKPKSPAEIQSLIEAHRPHTDFAEDLGISYSYLKYLLKGSKTPGYKLAIRMAKKLKVNLEDLVMWSANRVGGKGKKKK